MSTDKTRRLGRGLEALIPLAGSAPHATETAAPPSELQKLPVKSIHENPYQPRRTFDPAELAELEASLRENGLLQPITVRHAKSGKGQYELVAGERRLRAAARLGWKEIPALIRDFDDRTMLTMALVENLQRADLDPLEQAEGFQRLATEFGLTHQKISEMVGKDRSTVANLVRLLELPPAIRTMIQQSQITMGHARAILALQSQEAMTLLAREIVEKGLSVRAVEQRARVTTKRAPTPRKARADTSGKSPEVRRIEDLLRRRFQTDVRVEVHGADRGAVRIPFYSADDFDRILEFLHPSNRETV